MTRMRQQRVFACPHAHEECKAFYSFIEFQESLEWEWEPEQERSDVGTLSCFLVSCKDEACMLEAAPLGEEAIGEASLIEGLVAYHRYGETPPIFAEPYSVGKDGGKPIVSKGEEVGVIIRWVILPEAMPGDSSQYTHTVYSFNKGDVNMRIIIGTGDAIC